MNYVEENEEIIRELLESKKIKEGQLIDYAYFIEIYEPYEDKISEIDFAEILGIEYGNYLAVKNQGKRARVLKSRQEKISDEEKQKIIEELLKSNKIGSGQSIDYTYFIEIYEPYKNKMEEKEFAEMLEMTNSNYYTIKNRVRKARVLKSNQENISGQKIEKQEEKQTNKQKELDKKEKEKIIKELLEGSKITPEQSIDYTYFLEIYEPYKGEIEEQNFAEMIGINYSSYQAIKNRGLRARVLKNNQQEIDEEEREKIIEELLKTNKIIPGQLIDYTYFLLIYEPYKSKTEEIDFAKLLGINYGNYMHIKNGTRKTKVLKNRQENITEEEKEKIIEELLEFNKIILKQTIDYTYFLEIYEPYKYKMREVDFAEVLGISYNSYSNIKNSGTKAVVLKDRKISEKVKERIIYELVTDNKIKLGQSINYEVFLEVYEPYKHIIGETDFAGILGINITTFRPMKSQPYRKAKILKNRGKKLTEKEKQEIVEEVLEQRLLELGQSIDYEYFLEVYEPYKHRMREVDFAKILGITSSNYDKLKNIQTEVRVLRGIKKISEEEKELIIQELIDGNKVKPGQRIDYVCFLELYESYRSRIEKIDFAKLLGINYCNYMNMKNTGIRTKVEDYRNKRKIDRIRYILEKEARYYSKEELQEISEKYEINIDTIIQYIYCAGEDANTSDYTALLEEKGQIWIGSVKCSKQFATRHSETILKKAEEISKKLCSIYRCKNITQDIASDSVVYILEKCGDIDKNFLDEEEIAKKLITARMFMFIKYKCLDSTSKPMQYSFEMRYTNHKGDSRAFDTGIEDKTQNVQNEVEGKILEEIKRKQKKNLEEACVELLKIHMEAGLDEEKAITKTGQVLGVNPEVMVETIKTYMIKQNSVRQTKDGGFVLGE